MIKRLVSEAKIPGVHLCTLNLEKSVQRVLENLGWGVPNYNKVTNKLIAVRSLIVRQTTAYISPAGYLRG